MNSQHWQLSIRGIDECAFQHDKRDFTELKDDDLAFFAGSCQILLFEWLRADEAEFVMAYTMRLFALRREMERRRLQALEVEMLWQMKRAGFDFIAHLDHTQARTYFGETVALPTIAEMIVALDNRFGVLERFHGGGFGAYFPNDIGRSGTGATPLLALMRLWLVVGDRENHPDALPPETVDRHEAVSSYLTDRVRGQ